MKDRVLEIISEQFHIDKKNLNKTTSFADDLNADSIELVEMVMTLEDEFDISLDDEELVKIQTIGDVLELIEELE